MTLLEWFKQQLFCASCGVLRVYPAQCRQCKALICDLCADPYGALLHSPGKGLCPACRNAPGQSVPPGWNETKWKVHLEELRSLSQGEGHE